MTRIGLTVILSESMYAKFEKESDMRSPEQAKSQGLCSMCRFQKKKTKTKNKNKQKNKPTIHIPVSKSAINCQSESKYFELMKNNFDFSLQQYDRKIDIFGQFTIVCERLLGEVQT